MILRLFSASYFGFRAFCCATRNLHLYTCALFSFFIDFPLLFYYFIRSNTKTSRGGKLHRNGEMTCLTAQSIARVLFGAGPRALLLCTCALTPRALGPPARSYGAGNENFEILRLRSGGVLVGPREAGITISLLDFIDFQWERDLRLDEGRSRC